jgi:formate hydrogenlyase subunit 6/NADH:ubiquinone oxidoreductase subunit I
VNILRLIFDNLRRGTVSYPMPHTHLCTSNQYRGLIINDPERCVGCSQCAYVCPSAAIEVTRSGDNYTWTYNPSKCAFCGRCIDRCKPRTLTMKSQLPPLYSTQDELKQVLNMVRKRPVRPAAAAAGTAATANVTAPVAENAKPAEPMAGIPRKEDLA